MKAGTGAILSTRSLQKTGTFDLSSNLYDLEYGTHISIFVLLALYFLVRADVCMFVYYPRLG